MSWKPRHFNAPQQTTPSPKYGTQVSNQHFYNGAVENDYQTYKPSNLSNSAVLRMLQENENTSSVRKEVVWPPPHDDSEFADESDDNSSGYNNNYQQSQSGSNNVHHKKPSKPFRPPPATIPLRASPPITQEASPIFKSEPITISYRGGSRMRGDQKWPPPEYKAQADADNEARIATARGPQFRPPKPRKDYSSFFARNALPNTYPGYKAPPGTQHYEEENGYSNY